MIEVVKYTGQPIGDLEERLRFYDQVEVKATETTFEQSLHHDGLCFLIYVDGNLEGVYGCAYYSESLQSPYFLSSDKLFEKKENRIEFLRKSKEFVDSLAPKYGYSHLLNVTCIDRDKKSLDWLRWLGFRIHNEIFTLNNCYYKFSYFSK